MEFVHPDLIETSWNVKKKGSDADRDRKTDLIETSWNVKEQYARSGIRMEQDLIETSWNVKYLSLGWYQMATRFNRNIVECKVSCLHFLIALLCDLIETLWNVKFFLIRAVRTSALRFNRDIVECKVVIDKPARQNRYKI